MRNIWKLGVVILFGLSLLSVSAEDKLDSKFGVSFDYSGNSGIGLGSTSSAPGFGPNQYFGMPSIGAQYHFTEAIGLKAAMSMYGAGHTAEFTSYTTYSPNNQKNLENSNHSWAWELGFLYYFSTLKAIRVYGSPWLSAAIASSKSKSTTYGGTISETIFNYVSYGAGLGIALQYPLGDQLHIFAESKFGYWYTDYYNKNPVSSGSNDFTSNSYAIFRTGLGVIFYLN